MARSAVELDFFQIEKESSPKQHPGRLFDRRRSLRDIQGVITKLNPEILKSVITSSSGDAKPTENGGSLAPKGWFSVPSTPKHGQAGFPALPLFLPAFGINACGYERPPEIETAPLTIFYNGAVSVFNVTPHQADSIINFAGGEVAKTVELGDAKPAVPSSYQTELLEPLNGDLPIARRKSLLRFLEKRKERLTVPTPYGSPEEHAIQAGKRRQIESREKERKTRNG